MTDQSRDYSAIDSLPKALRLLEGGRLERLYMFPLEFGGKEIPENTIYVPPGITAIKQQIDSVIGDMVREGTITRYVVEPEYKGRSIVPSKLKIKTSHPHRPGGVDRTIDIW